MPRRHVEIVTESPEHIHARIRVEHQPLFVRLCQIAFPEMEMYQSDLCHDALGLAKAEVGDKFLWGHRKTGTTLIKLTDCETSEEMLELVTASCCELSSWHLLEVSKVRDNGHTDGYCVWINAPDLDKLKAVVKDNTTREVA